MKITIIGSGNTATVLARLCTQKGHQINQIIARNAEKGNLLANEFNGSYINFSEIPDVNTDIVIVALSDNSIPEALKELNFNKTPVVHTSGSCSIDVIKKISESYGVLYPLQSLRKELNDISEIPFLIEANNESTLKFIKEFAATLSHTVVMQNFEERIRLHTAAVIVNNFTNYLYGMAEKFCNGENVNFNLLKPIIKETANRIQQNSPLAVQTGPATRNDIATIDKHLNLLKKYPTLKRIYMSITDGIMNK